MFDQPNVVGDASCSEEQSLIKLPIADSNLMGLEWDIVPIHVPHSRAQGCKSKVVFDAKHLENQAKEKGELLWPRSLKMEVRRKDKIHCSSSHTAICLPGSLPIEEETLSVLGLGGGWWGRSPLCSTNSPPVLLVE